MTKLMLTAVALALLASAASADYKTCMTYCMDEYSDFSYCHSICKEAPAETDDAPETRPAFEFTPPPDDICSRHDFDEDGPYCADLKEEFRMKQLFRSGDCSIEGAKVQAFDSFLTKHYGISNWMLKSHNDDSSAWNMIFWPLDTERECEGSIRVDDTCRITGADGTSLDNALARERILPCR